MKKLYILLVFIFVIIVSSCSAGNKNEAAEDAIDGLSFNKFNSNPYTISGVEYDIYFPTNTSEAIYYQYKLGDVKSTSAVWTINFIYMVDYHIDRKWETDETWNSLYSILKDEEIKVEEKCGFDVTLFDPANPMVELEYVLTNETKEEASYVIFYTFLPIRLHNKSQNKTTTVGVPVKVDLLLKTEDKIKNPFKDEMMLWEDFLAIENL